MHDVANSTGETSTALGYSRNAMQQATEVWNQFKNVGLQVGEIMLPVISAGLTVAGGVLGGVSVVMDTVIGFFSSWYALIQEGNPIIIGLTTTLGILTAAMALNYAWTQKAVVIGGIKKCWILRRRPLPVDLPLHSGHSMRRLQLLRLDGLPLLSVR